MPPVRIRAGAARKGGPYRDWFGRRNQECPQAPARIFPLEPPRVRLLAEVTMAVNEVVRDLQDRLT
jgi:hypothetical protein